MDAPLFDEQAPKEEIELTVNADLYAKAKAAGIDLSSVVEEALIRALSAKQQRDRLIEQIQRGSEAVARYVQQHGDPVAEWHQMFDSPDAA